MSLNFLLLHYESVKGDGSPFVCYCLPFVARVQTYRFSKDRLKMHAVHFYAPAALHKCILLPAFTMLCLIHECDIWHVPELQRNQCFQRQRQPSFSSNFILWIIIFSCFFFSPDISLWASLSCRPNEMWKGMAFLGGLVEFCFWIVYRWLAHNKGWKTVSLGRQAIFSLVSSF